MLHSTERKPQSLSTKKHKYFSFKLGVSHKSCYIKNNQLLLGDAGLPATLTTILLTITLRIVADNSSKFRKYSGTRELVFGFSRLLACLLTPIFLLKIELNNLVSVSLIIYLIGLVLFWGLDLKQFINEKIPESFVKINHLLLKSRDTWIVCLPNNSIIIIDCINLPFAYIKYHKAKGKICSSFSRLN